MLQEAVQVALAADDSLDASAIVIVVAQGIVDLSGTVGSVDDVRRALRRAGDVDGVRGIVNRLLVVVRDDRARVWPLRPSGAFQVLHDQ